MRSQFYIDLYFFVIVVICSYDYDSEFITVKKSCSGFLENRHRFFLSYFP